MSESITDTIEIGTGVTMICGSDLYPFIVTGKTPKTLKVREVRTGKNKLVWPEQDFEIFMNQPCGDEVTLRFGSRKGWTFSGTRYSVGKASYYLDPSF
jgi:hypothetical protein